MELTKMEIAIVEKVITEAAADQSRELLDLELAFVGGGIAELVGH